jgi:hypothetical protein
MGVDISAFRPARQKTKALAADVDNPDTRSAAFFEYAPAKTVALLRNVAGILKVEKIDHSGDPAPPWRTKPIMFGL